MISTRTPILLGLLFGLPIGLAAQDGTETPARTLTLEAIVGSADGKAIEVNEGMPEIVGWLDDDRYLQRSPQKGQLETTLAVDADSGKSRPAYDRATMTAALAELPGMDRESALGLSAPESFEESTERSAALINHADDLFFYRFETGEARRLTMDPAPEVGEEISPDGRTVSFVRDHDLYLVDVESLRERRLTDGGGPELFYGRLDWVYQEEIYGRGNFKGYWWSPDSRRIAFLKLDESPVREFTVVDHLPHRGRTEITNYPKAGDPNPTVTLGVISVAGGPITWIDLSRYADTETLIVRVGWTPNAEHVVFQIQDREQTWLDLVRADPQTGEAEVLLHETSPAWVEAIEEPTWLSDGTLLWLSERTGYRHLYRFDPESELQEAVTQGDWEVRTLYGVTDDGTVFFGAMRDDPIAENVYSAPLEGGEVRRLSAGPGTHKASFNPSLTRWIETWSTVETPPAIAMRSVAGSKTRSIWEASKALDDFALGSVERHRVPTRDGFEMEAFLIKPPDFDPTRKYPVLQYTYAGPHAPVVQDQWPRRDTRLLWHHLLAQQGTLIWMCDNRSASGKGQAPTWKIHQNFGELELQDIEDGLEWLGENPWVDSDRIGIWGWSFGGYMTAYALTHSDRFRLGIAGAPVTDWHLYDSVYTERYMRRPQNNPEGYDASSVVEAAADLSGSLLILHGTIDDNVHFQNTVQLVYALQKAGKDFDLMIYPKSRHGVRDPDLQRHLYRTMTDFVKEHL